MVDREADLAWAAARTCPDAVPARPDDREVDLGPSLQLAQRLEGSTLDRLEALAVAHSTQTTVVTGRMKGIVQLMVLCSDLKGVGTMERDDQTVVAGSWAADLLFAQIAVAANASGRYADEPPVSVVAMPATVVLG